MSKSKKEDTKTKRFFSTPVLFFFLAGLYPVVFLVSKNWFVYNPKQLLFLITVPIITGLVGIIFSLVLPLIKKLISKTINPKLILFISKATDKNRIVNKLTSYFNFDNRWCIEFIYSLIGFLIFYILLKTTITRSEFLPYIFFLTAFVISILIRRINFFYINVAILIMTLTASLEMIYSITTKSITNEFLIPNLDKDINQEIIFQDKPNIYLIHLESYHSPYAMRTLYNYDNQNFVEQLSGLGFHVCDNSYSNYKNTLTSTAVIFLREHHYYTVSSGMQDAVGVRDMNGGKLYNPTLKILKNNSYKIYYLHGNTYIFSGCAYLDYYYPKETIHDSLLIFQNETINKIRAEIFDISQRKVEKKQTVTVEDTEFYQELWDGIIHGNKEDSPAFFYIYGKNEGVRHSPSDGSYTYSDANGSWNDKYIKLVQEANIKIYDLIQKIVEIDPEGIIILYGDHGSWKYRGILDNISKEEDINEIIYERSKINGEPLALDMFGSFLALRYPNGDPSIIENETHVNIFRVLFSELSKSDVLLENKPENDSYYKMNKQIFRFVKDGKALESIEVVK